MKKCETKYQKKSKKILKFIPFPEQMIDAN